MWFKLGVICFCPNQNTSALLCTYYLIAILQRQRGPWGSIWMCWPSSSWRCHIWRARWHSGPLEVSKEEPDHQPWFLSLGLPRAEVHTVQPYIMAELLHDMFTASHPISWLPILEVCMASRCHQRPCGQYLSFCCDIFFLFYLEGTETKRAISYLWIYFSSAHSQWPGFGQAET